MHVVRSMRVRGANKTLKRACRKPPKSAPDVPKPSKIEPGALQDTQKSTGMGRIGRIGGTSGFRMKENGAQTASQGGGRQIGPPTAERARATGRGRGGVYTHVYEDSRSFYTP